MQASSLRDGGGRFETKVFVRLRKDTPTSSFFHVQTKAQFLGIETKQLIVVGVFCCQFDAISLLVLLNARKWEVLTSSNMQ